MARPLRIELAGGLYHVMSRGDRREAIYLDDADRGDWLTLLGDVCERFNWRCHAYCLMTNHYHIVVETPEANLSAGMRQLNGVHTQHFNRRHGRVGHVFQGRYKGILVDKDDYLLELARYVVLNPVRANMVGDAGEWPWSSYAAMVGDASAQDWLETDWLLGQFGQQWREAVRGYVDFVRAGVGLESIWTHLNCQVFLGNDAFVDDVKQQLPADRDLSEVPRIQHRPRAKPLAYYAGFADPREGMAAAYLSGGYTMRTIAAVFGVHYSTVSRVVSCRVGQRSGSGLANPH